MRRTWIFAMPAIAALCLGSLNGATAGTLTQKISLAKPECDNPQCYVQVHMKSRSPFAHGVGAQLTEPSRLATRIPGVTTGQIALTASPTGKELQTVEIGWMASSVIYEDSFPHLFIFVRDNPHKECQVGIPMERVNPKIKPCEGWEQFSGTPKPGDRVGNTPGPKTYHIGYDAGTDSWWFQYGDRWIGRLPASYWEEDFRRGDRVAWYGEVWGDTCVQMGNGQFGTHPAAAKMTGMFYEYMEGDNSRVAPAKGSIAEVTDPSAWNYGEEEGSPNGNITAFRYGGPGRC